MPEEKQAQLITEIWNNFQPDNALAPDSPFRVERDDYMSHVAVQALQRANPDDYQKWFLIGHRGGGKSTYLRYLLNMPSITAKFHTLRFSIQEKLDKASLSYLELLYLIASELVQEALKTDAFKNKPAVKKDLENWGGEIVKEVNKEQNLDVEVTGGLKTIFAGFVAKLQSQRVTRESFKIVIEPKVTELTAIIDNISLTLEQALGKPILIAIDDIDKPDKKIAQALFEDHYNSMCAPKCNIIYTVPVSLIHEKTIWVNLEPTAWYVPNIKLYYINKRNENNQKGIEFMQAFTEKRMNLNLIEEDALNELIKYSGGVFRQMCRLMQIASDLAEYREKLRITLAEVQSAVAEHRNGLVPQLSTEDLAVLKQVAENNQAQTAYEHPELLHNLSVLLYRNDDLWHDVNPVLWERVDSYEPDT